MPLRKIQAVTSKIVTMRGSIIRAGVFMLAWFFLPWWLFLPVALYLYFQPFSEAKIVSAPFLGILILCLVQPVGWFFAIIFGFLFWYTLLIKDLYIIDRKSAYEMLSLAVIFLLMRSFYLDMGGQPGSLVAGLSAFILAGLFAAIMNGFINGFPVETPTEITSAANQKVLRRITTLAIFLLFFQLLLVGLFLPLDFIYQSIVVFLLGTLIIEFFPYYLFGNLSRSKLLTTTSVVFVLLVLVLGSARWGL